jgi:hypothetical protein
MKLNSDVLIVVLLVVSSSMMLPGCSFGTKGTMATVQLQGEIDATATPQAQAKQNIVKNLLNAIREGATDKGSLSIHAPGIDFREDEAKLLDGHAWLARWSFAGPVEGNNVPVVLYFSDREFDFGDPSQHFESQRIYSVTGSRAKFVVNRVK